MAEPERCMVFDFGNVIALFDHMVACQRLASLSRPPRDPDDVYERIFNDRPDYVAAGSALGMQAFVYDPALPPPAF